MMKLSNSSIIVIYFMACCVIKYEEVTNKLVACYFNGPFLYTEKTHTLCNLRATNAGRSCYRELIISQLYESFQNKFLVKCLLGRGDNRVLKH